MEIVIPVGMTIELSFANFQIAEAADSDQNHDGNASAWDAFYPRAVSAQSWSRTARGETDSSSRRMRHWPS
jgi:hypothetical protein